MSSFISVPLIGAIVFPPWSVFSVLYVGFLLFNALVAGIMQTKEETQTGYSKFAKGAKGGKRQVSSKTGMLLIYAPALMCSIYWGWTNREEASLRWSMVNSMLIFHFLKRVLEVLFVHVYSGTMDLAEAASVISISYTLNAYLINMWTAVLPLEHINDALFVPGAALFVIGQSMNFYHHVLLARLRTAGSGGSTKKYVVPEGGFFYLVTCPHFFGELLSWYGIALLSQTVGAWVITTFMTTYLMGRAYATTQWYYKKMNNYPANRKHIFPYIF